MPSGIQLEADPPHISTPSTRRLVMGRELGDANAAVALIVQGSSSRSRMTVSLTRSQRTAILPLTVETEASAKSRSGAKRGEFVPSRTRELRSESRRHTPAASGRDNRSMHGNGTRYHPSLPTWSPLLVQSCSPTPDHPVYSANGRPDPAIPPRTKTEQRERQDRLALPRLACHGLQCSLPVFCRQQPRI